MGTVIEELVNATPCVLSSKELGPNEDKDPEWRATAVYDRDELIKLISSELLPPDRRMMYALMGLAGLRHGEMAGLRWRNDDPTREPLGTLVVARSYDQATTKSKRPREVPVHPTLAKLLDDWHAHGCTQILGHAPEPDDLLVPSRECDMRSRDHTRNKLLEDIERFGLRSRRGHDLRRSSPGWRALTALALTPSKRVSHAPRANIINIYTSMPWENLCAEVAKLRIELPRHAEVIPPRHETTKRRKPGTKGCRAHSRSNMVEAPGVESAGWRKPTETVGESPGARTRADTGGRRSGRNADDIAAALPAGRVTLADRVRAADRAIIEGDVHGARRVLAEVLEALDADVLSARSTGG